MSAVRIRIAVFGVVVVAGLTTNILAVRMSAEQLIGSLIMGAAMGVSFPAVYLSRIAANTPDFPRSLLWPTFWSVELFWGLVLASFFGLIAKRWQLRSGG